MLTKPRLLLDLQHFVVVVVVEVVVAVVVVVVVVLVVVVVVVEVDVVVVVVVVVAVVAVVVVVCFEVEEMIQLYPSLSMHENDWIAVSGHINIVLLVILSTTSGCYC
jgi:hypothetical protein